MYSYIFKKTNDMIYQNTKVYVLPNQIYGKKISKAYAQDNDWQKNSTSSLSVHSEIIDTIFSFCF